MMTPTENKFDKIMSPASSVCPIDDLITTVIQLEIVNTSTVTIEPRHKKSSDLK
jgi:hypothetical protein